MHVVATAGHVDHGKSTLVRALTGMEPDRFAEERRRGMTIDLGYAWTTLPSGVPIAFVDVPGHQRFIANMLTGIGPAPAVLFVVAADEGWARQSTEHLAAIDALGVRHGLLAVTRSDLADPEPARAAALDRLTASSLGRVESVAVSGTTGAGLSELRGALDRLVAALPAPVTDGRVRLWLDRSFAIRGAGTVVTGTLSAGTVAVGDELELRGRTVAIRGVQVTGSAQQSVPATARVALNVRGVATSEVGRGDVLTTPGAWHWTSIIDVRLQPAHDAADRLPTELVVHIGTAAVPVRVRPLGADVARLSLAHPLPINAGDRAVLRDPGRHAVAAGVLVLDADPPALTRRGAAAARAAALAGADGTPDLRAEAGRRGAILVRDVERLGIARRPDIRRIDDWYVDGTAWQDWTAAACRVVDDWPTRDPLEPHPPLAAVRRRVGLPDAPPLLAALVTEAGLVITAGRVSRPGSAPPVEVAAPGIRVVADRLRTRPFDAPERDELRALGLGRRELAAAERGGVLLRLADDIVLSPDAPAAALALLRPLPQPFTASAARRALDTTRRVAIPLLEHLDSIGATQRIDGRHRRVTNTP